MHGYTDGVGGKTEFLKKYFQELGWVFVEPEGLDRSWNARYCCGKSLQNNVDDVGFIEAVPAFINTEVYPISPANVFLSGLSNGGFMTEYVLTTAADRLKGNGSVFKAAVAVAGHMYEGVTPEKVKPIPILLQHSPNDPIVNYHGCCANSSCCCDIDKKSPVCVPTRSTFRAWGKVNGCSELEPTVSFSGTAFNTDVNNTVNITCLTLMGCTANTTLCEYTGFTRYFGHILTKYSFASHHLVQHFVSLVHASN